MSHRRAFTLIELLVVISIIAVLVSIVLPALGTSRQTARRAKCLANLRSIGQGFTLYLKDSKDIFPKVNPLHGGNGGNPNDPSMLDLLADYLDAPVPRREDPSNTSSPYIVTDPYRCPEDRAGAGANQNQQPVYETDGTSYEYLPGAFMLLGELLLLKNPPFGVTKAYEKDRHWPILTDWDDFHKMRPRGPHRNAVFFPDMQADWMIDIGPTEASRFIDDMTRYGGLPTP